ncbi:MAG: carbohydrate kinase family protein [Verrucomicrobiales bacterium]|nr:carbohydrate kinase family protein [Verrucomicrobiales bacterium]
MSESVRSGLLAAGNFIVDHVKIIDHYPQENMLASILSQSSSNGGGPYNVLKDLAAMRAPFPLEACGLVGADDHGRWIRNDLRAHGIDAAQLHETPERATSYTDAMTVASTGRRTFFHQRGANALFDAGHCDFSRTRAKLFHLGYLMLLDTLDRFDEAAPGRTRASILLEKAKTAGLVTTLDIVSTEHPQFSEIVRSALPFTDHLLLNEAEAARVLQRDCPADQPAALMQAARDLLALGVGSTVTLHTEHGAVAVTRDGEEAAQPALQLPPDFSRGATGAGDAFAAGYLLGLHDDRPLAHRLMLAVCAAAQSLTHPAPSAGLVEIKECLALAQRFPFRSFSL